MKITVLTLFPKIFDNFLKESIIKRIQQKNIVKIDIIDFRKFSLDKNQRVDDHQIGGGPGMVIQLQPIVDAIRKYRSKNTKVILLSPQGKTFNQSEAIKLSKCKDIILIAGHYEGFDERIINYVDEVISIGDYILTGGEVPAMVLIETITRLLDHAITNESLVAETFNHNLLDYPAYAKPLIYDNHKVPEVLLSGNHQAIEKYRYQQQLLKTKINRPDLYKKHIKEKQHGN
jgi:tRNA (guanine37-N1)-methyltransferase